MVCVRLKSSECAVSHSTHNRSCWRQADWQKGHLDQKKSFHLNFPSKTFACFPLTCSDYRKALSHSYWLAEHQQRQRHQTLLADTNTSYSWLCAFRTHQGTEEIHLEEQNPMTKVETDKVQETLNHTIIKLSRKLSLATLYSKMCTLWSNMASSWDSLLHRRSCLFAGLHSETNLALAKQTFNRNTET